MRADFSGARDATQVGNVEDTVNYTFGVAYQLNPAVRFELLYDKIDYGTGNHSDFRSGDDHLVRFRTQVVF